MPRQVEVEFPVVVTVTIPDGYSLSADEVAEIAFDTVSQQCSICIEERDGQPVEWASCYSEIMTDEVKVNCEYLQEPTAGPE